MYKAAKEIPEGNESVLYKKAHIEQALVILQKTNCKSVSKWLYMSKRLTRFAGRICLGIPLQYRLGTANRHNKTHKRRLLTY